MSKESITNSVGLASKQAISIYRMETKVSSDLKRSMEMGRITRKKRIYH
jgi:hypothetical protein